MSTRYVKNEFWIEKPRYRMPTGLYIARLAILFTIICTVATVVMLFG